MNRANNMPEGEEFAAPWGTMLKEARRHHFARRADAIRGRTTTASGSASQKGWSARARARANPSSCQTMKATIKKPKHLVRPKPSATLTKSLTLAPPVNETVIELVPSLLKIGQVLVPLDFSDGSLKALHYAVQFAEQFGSKLILIHVVEVYPIDYVFGLKAALDSNQWQIEQARAQLERMCESLAWPRSVCAERVVLFGKPFHQICDAAMERSVDLIIIATHGRTGLQRLQMGSTAERVVRHAPCPVLVVREQEKEFG